MVETKHYAFHLLKRRLTEKVNKYAETTFLIPKGKIIRMKDGTDMPLIDVIPNQLRPVELPIRARGLRKDHALFKAEYIFSPVTLHKSYDMSMTALIELICRMGYTKIITYGIDLFNSLYFWGDGDAKYGETHHKWNKEHEGRNPYDVHNTFRIREFFFDFNLLHMVPKSRQIYVGHKDTALFPGILYINLKQLLESFDKTLGPI